MLTEAQKWALKAVADGFGGSPAALGERMMDRPGAMGTRTAPYKAQGYGRMGGAMMSRLQKLGFVRTSIMTPYGFWCPTRATITPAGRAALEKDAGGRE